MKLSLKISVTIIALFSANIVAEEQQKPSVAAAKQADIRLLMEVTGTSDLSMQMITHMIASFQETLPDVPDEMWIMFLAETDPNEMIELCIPCYEKHFTHDEIKQLLQFYKTPLGQQIIKKQPLIMQDCMNAGQQWGQKISAKVMKNIEEYYGMGRPLGDISTVRERKLSSSELDCMVFQAAKHFDGQDIPINRIEAFRLYKLAADSGSRKALPFQAYCYKHGIGVQQDEKTAQVLYTGFVETPQFLGGLPIEVAVDISEDGVVSINGLIFGNTKIPFPTDLGRTLATHLEAARVCHIDFIVNIRPCQNAPHVRILEVMDVCYHEGVEHVSLWCEAPNRPKIPMKRIKASADEQEEKKAKPRLRKRVVPSKKPFTDITMPKINSKELDSEGIRAGVIAPR